MRIIFLVLIILGLTTLPLNAASYGLRVRDAKGKVILDVTDRITRHVYTSTQTASSGNSGALSQLEGVLSGEFAVPVNGGTTSTAHNISRSGTTITWTTYSYDVWLSPATCVIFSFVYS